jgi:hypothetical protein
MLWERIDELLERAPHVRALRFHRLELLEVRRRRSAGLPALAELAADAAQAVIADLAVPALLTRARDVCDGRLVLVKGPELALDYPGPGLRRFGDLDLLADDPAAAQAAMLAAGFQEVGDPALYEDIHHLRPLGWPGLPLIIELHSRPKWPELLPAPAVAELLEAAVPSRLGVAGIETLPAAHHAVLVAAHSWAHEPLARIGHLVDVAVTLDRADRADVRAIARAWGARRAWDCTEAAVDAVVHGHGRSAAAAVWARHLRPVRERTVLESHMQEWLAPVWGLPTHRMPQALGRALRDELRRESAESWRTKLARSRIAVGNAGLARADHDLALEARGHTLRETTEAR